MQIEMKIEGEDLAYDIEEELFFDVDEILDRMTKHSGKLAWWSSLLATKEKELNNAKVKLEGKIAEVEIGLRTSDDLEQKYGKKPTEGVISAEMAANPKVIKWKEQLAELRYHADLLKAMVRGYEANTGILTTAGSLRRSEVEAMIRQNLSRTKEKAGQGGS